MKCQEGQHKCTYQSQEVWKCSACGEEILSKDFTFWAPECKDEEDCDKLG